MRYFQSIEQVDAWIARMRLSAGPLSYAERKELDEAEAWCAADYEIARADYHEAIADLLLSDGKYPVGFDDIPDAWRPRIVAKVEA